MRYLVASLDEEVPPMLTRFLHSGVHVFQTLRRCVWFLTRPRAIGVHGIPITANGNVVLVKLSYARGWRLPGGGLRRDEDSRSALIRELREEIGLIGFETVTLVTGFEHRPDHRRGTGTLFLVTGVRYKPRWSLEVERVCEFPLNSLPDDAAQITIDLINTASNHLEPYRRIALSRGDRSGAGKTLL